ncbi:MAG: hypothetical protein OXI30_06130 [Chloroflexota bacterium]|nr:hypothetical protein [Chloroflexota bacterium]
MSLDLFRQTLEAQRLAQADLLRRRGVVGVAVGFRNYKEQATDQLALAVLVQQKKPIEALSADDIVPSDVNGAKTDVVEVGRLEALVNPRDRFRPNIPAGVSIGHYKVTAGTLGAIVFDRNTGEPLILSNNHVLANSNDAEIGDAILQPGPTDHGVRPDDVVAKLHRFEMLRFYNELGTGPSPPTSKPPLFPPGGCDIVELFATVGNTLGKISGSSKRLTSVPRATPQTEAAPIYANRVDAALARPDNPMLFQQAIVEIGRPNGIKLAQLGMEVRKQGRTTGYTEGAVTLMNATVDVSYGEDFQARFVGQVISTPMSQGGDSGALIMERDSLNAVGLLFAGSRRATIFTPIQTVLDVMDIEL